MSTAADSMSGLPSAIILRSDALSLPIADASVDLIVTSPPYFALRSYQDGGEHYAGQLGSEATPDEFVTTLLAATREMVRVLKPSGSLWVNLGDKYSQRVAIRPSSHQDGLFPGRPDLPKDWKRDKARGLTRMPYQNITNPDTGAYVPEKSLMGLPWRYALRCIDELGLILRAEVIWSKPNGLPESVTDRVRRSHEQWFHFTVSPRYFAAVDEIREPHLVGSNGATFGGKTRAGVRVGSGERRYGQNTYDELNPLGKLPGSVREVPSAPLKVPAHLGVDHFAAFPPAWPAWIIRGWSPTGICTVCGEGRRPVVDKGLEIRQRHLGDRQDRNGDNRWGTSWRETGGATVATITGYACGCPTPDAPTRPATVLDPFGGTGTTAMAARALGRHGISVDLSADYSRLARWRCRNGDELAAARGLPRAGRPDSPDPDLLDLMGAPS